MRGDAKTIGSLILRPGHELLRDRARVAVGGRTLALISLLAKADGAVVTKDELLEAIWPGRLVEENALHAQISSARKALGDEAGRLVTVHGLGYRLDLKEEQSGSTDEHRASASVAVLPFENLSADPDNIYLADGLAEELITTLSRTPHLNVPSRTSSFAYRGRAVDARQIGRELGVAKLIEGSVRVAGSRVRATVQLINVETGFHEWAGNFDRELTDLFVFQDEMAAAIASAMQVHLAERRAPTSDIEAYQSYLQGRLLIERWDIASVPKASELLRKAIARDPNFALAKSALAALLSGASVEGLLPLTVRDEALALAADAAEAEPGHVGAQVVLACLDSLRGRWLDADKRFADVIAAAAHEPWPAHGHALYVLAPCGLLARARAEAERAYALAPAAALFAFGCSSTAAMSGDWENMFARLDVAEQLGMSSDEPALRLYRASRTLMLGDREAGAAQVAAAFPEALREDAEVTARWVFAAAFAGGSREDAIAGIRRFAAANDLDALLARASIPFCIILQWHVMNRDLDGAFAFADAMIETWHRTGHMPVMALLSMWPPQMAPFRNDARFAVLARRLGLLDYWRLRGPPDGYRLEGDRLVAL
jgi:TolB-like protein